MNDDRSRPLSVHLGEGVSDMLRDWTERVTDLRTREVEATAYEELADLRNATFTAAFGLLNNLTHLLRTSDYDGPDLHIWVDPSVGEGLGWRYTRSGYEGGLIRRDDTWSIHT